MFSFSSIVLICMFYSYGCDVFCVVEYAHVFEYLGFSVLLRDINATVNLLFYSVIVYCVSIDVM